MPANRYVILSMTITTSVEVIQEVSSVTATVLPNASNTAIISEPIEHVVSEPSIIETIIMFIINLV